MSPAAGVLAAVVQAESASVSPGLVGFLATFALVVAAIFLFLSMARHLRKVDHSARVRGDDPDIDDRAEESSLEEPPGDDEPRSR